ncbi:MAG: acyltransferase family protein, partial [Hyphomonas sp.]
IPALISLLLTWDVAGVASYLGANLVFLNFLSPTLPGLFEDNRFSAVNGALWTLKIEVMFYLVLPVILFVLNRMKALWWVGILALYVGGEVWAYLVPRLGAEFYGAELARQLPGQMAFFAMGIALWKASPGIQRRWGAMALCGTALLGATFLHPMLEPLRPLALAGVIGAVAWAPGPKLNVARFGDISYGLYITHFPILQALAAAGLVTSLGFAGFFAIATALTLAASFALWHLVEKPALRPSSHYRRVAAET